ncbi:DUF1156 domain-containing protein [Listeria monocytogenes]|nr:DUF1156 domain-containing protein [Listeria monocytogenes]EAE8422585.1 DUF1156 domain-containing protein [Listeria monocytogenes]EAF8941942.1 DUF1156 domain-containing protein [Listeria monocytogenes]EAF8947948.1 DUF1156 domain-containing protein [Listeria monocytogenes]EAF8951093.1 DUF1156 domain-containing protein [Listeria monocytogenes]
MKFEKIPELTLIEKTIPIKAISELAKIEGNSKRPIYSIHKWWARRLSSVVRAIILAAFLPYDTTEETFWKAYYQSNDLSKFTVLDTFMGGGTCIVESKKMKAKVIGVDIDPLACFVTKKEIESYEGSILNQEYNRVIKNVEKIVAKYYQTKVENDFFEVINFFWAYDVVCEKCKDHIASHPHYYLAKDKNSIIAFCKHCGKIEELPANRKRFKCKNCNKMTDIYRGSFKRGVSTCSKCGSSISVSSSVNGIQDLKLFAIEYVSNGKRYYKSADDYDLDLYAKAQKEYLNLNRLLKIPQDIIPTSTSGDTRPQSHGYLQYKDLFNYRQLLTLGLLLDEILKTNDDNIREWLLLSFSDCLASNNVLCCYAYDYKKLTPLFGIHAYTVPSRVVENNVLGTSTLGRGTFKKTFQKMKRGKEYCQKPYEVEIDDKQKRKKVFTGETINDSVAISVDDFYDLKGNTLILNQSSENLQEIKNNTIDVILTDPPYYDNLAYSELSAFYYVWIKKYIGFKHDSILDHSIFVTSVEQKSYEIYLQQLTNVFTQCYSKLKNEGIMIFSFHHNKVEAWTSLAQAIKKSSFKVTNVLPIRSEGNSAYHSSEESIKWDSIIVLRKNSKNIFIENDSWENKIEYCFEELQMKKCDILSFYRSLKLKDYVNTCFEEDMTKDINEFFDEHQKEILDVFRAREDNNATDK